jgi:hypothetical protein
MHNRTKVTVSVITGLLLGATVFTGSAASAGDPPRPLPVAEQNLDANGNIKVHEQGTVQVQEKRVPFQLAVSHDDWTDKTARSFGVDVPEGKVLIVQTISFSAEVEPGQDVRAGVTFQGAGGLSNLNVPLDHQGTFGGNDHFVSTESISAYASGTDGGIAFVARSSSSGTGGRIQFSVTGYLVDK